MKQLMPKITVEDTYTCDWCGKDCGYWPAATCHGCGKHACNESCWYTHLVKYTGGWPLRLDGTGSFDPHGTGIYVPAELYFCKSCNQNHEVAVLCALLQDENDKMKNAFGEYRRNHHNIARKINRLLEKESK